MYSEYKANTKINTSAESDITKLSSETVETITAKNNVPLPVIANNQEKIADNTSEILSEEGVKQNPAIAKLDSQGFSKSYKTNKYNFVLAEVEANKQKEELITTMRTDKGFFGNLVDSVFSGVDAREKSILQNNLRKANRGKGHFETALEEMKAFNRKPVFVSQSGFTGQAVSGVVGSVPKMALSSVAGAGAGLVTAAVTGGTSIIPTVIGLATAGATTYGLSKDEMIGDVYGQLISAGVPEKEASEIAEKEGKFQAGVEGLDPVLGGVGGKVLKGTSQLLKGVGKIIKKEGSDLLSKKGLRMIVAEGIKEGVSTAAVEGAGEYTQEGLQAISTEAALRQGAGLTREEAYNSVIQELSADMMSGNLSESSKTILDSAMSGLVGGVLFSGAISTSQTSLKTMAQLNKRRNINKKLNSIVDNNVKNFEKMAEKASPEMAEKALYAMEEQAEIPQAVYLTKEAKLEIATKAKTPEILMAVLSSLDITAEEFESELDSEANFVNYIKTKAKYGYVLNQMVQDNVSVDHITNETTAQLDVEERYIVEKNRQKTNDAIKANNFFADVLRESNLTSQQKSVATELLTNMVVNISKARTDIGGVGELLGNVKQGLLIKFAEKAVAEAAKAPETKMGKKAGANIKDAPYDTKSDIDDIRGQFTVEGLLNIISLFGKHNITTVLHESNHWYWRMLVDGHREGRLNNKYKKDVENVFEWLGKKRNAKSGEFVNVKMTDNDYEKLALALEAKLFDGKTFTSSMETLVSELSEWFQDVYSASKSFKQQKDAINVDDKISRTLDLSLFAREQVLTQEEKNNNDGISTEGYMFPEEIKEYNKVRKQARRQETLEIGSAVGKAIIGGNTKSMSESVEAAENEFKEKHKNDRVFTTRTSLIRKKLDRDTLIKAGVNVSEYAPFVTKDAKTEEVMRENIPFPEPDTLEGLTPDIKAGIQDYVEIQKSQQITYGLYILDRVEKGLYVDQEAINKLKEIERELKAPVPAMPEDFLSYIRNNGKLSIKGFMEHFSDIKNHPSMSGSKNYRGLATHKSKNNENELLTMIKEFTGIQLTDTMEAVNFLANAMSNANYGEEFSKAAEIEAQKESKEQLSHDLSINKESISAAIKKAKALSKGPNLSDNLFRLEDARIGRNPTDVAGALGYNNFTEMLEDVSSVGTLEQEAKKVGKKVKNDYIVSELAKDDNAKSFLVANNYYRFKQAVIESRVLSGRNLSKLNETMFRIQEDGNAIVAKTAFRKNYEDTIKSFQAKQRTAAIKSEEEKRNGNIEESIRQKQEEAAYIYASDKIKKEGEKYKRLEKVIKNYGKKIFIKKYNEKYTTLVRTIANQMGLVKAKRGKYNFDQYASAIDDAISGMHNLGMGRSMMDVKSTRNVLWEPRELKSLTYFDVMQFSYISDQILTYGHKIQKVKYEGFGKEIERITKEMKEENDGKTFKKSKTKLKVGNETTFGKITRLYGKFFDENFAGSEWVFAKWGEKFYFNLIQPINDAMETRDEKMRETGDKIKALFKEHGKELNFSEQKMIRGVQMNKTNMILLVMYYGRLDAYKDLKETLTGIYGELSDEQIEQTIQEILSNMSKLDKDFIDLMFHEYDAIFKLRESSASQLEDKVVHKSEGRNFEDAEGRKFKGGYIPLVMSKEADFNSMQQFSMGGGMFYGEGANNSITRYKSSELNVEKLFLSQPLYEAYTYGYVLPAAIKARDFIKANEGYITDKFGERDVDIAKRYFKDLFFVASSRPATDKIFSMINTAGKIAVLGGRPIMVPIQSLGFLAAAPNLKGYLVPALAKYIMTSPQELVKATLRQESRDKYMTDRFLGANKYGIEELNVNSHQIVSGKLNKTKRAALIVHMSFLGIGDRIASEIVWDAAYAKAKEELNYSDKRSRDYASREVRLTQGDYSSFAREMAPMAKMFLPFTSYLATQMNQYKFFRDSNRKGELVSMMVWVMILSPIMEDLIKYVGKGDKDRETFKDFVKAGLGNIVETMGGMIVPGAGGSITSSVYYSNPWRLRTATPLTNGVSEFKMSLSAFGDIVGLDGDLDILEGDKYYDMMKHLAISFGQPMNYFDKLEKVLDK